MDSSHDKKRMNGEGDRLSNLPDDLIHKILALIRIKSAIQTSVLSSRWRYIWTSMPCLDFSSEDFRTPSELQLGKFSEFATHVLFGRNDKVEVSSVMLTFRGKFNHVIFERILNYAFSHNVQQLNITCLCGTESEFPLSLLRSQALKHLTLNGYFYDPAIRTPPTWELPTLATLNLHGVTLHDDNTDKCAGLFSKCVNLKKLTVKKCRLRGSNGFNICHPGLSTLTLEDGCKDVNVLTPQLKNLTIKNCRRIHLISAPNLSALHYKDYFSFRYNYYYDDDEDDDYYHDDTLQLSTELLHLEKVHMCINRFFAYKAYTSKIVCLLQQLSSVRYLALNLEFVKLLSSSVELISHQPSPFVNLKSLKIYPADVTEPKVTMSTEVKNYLLDSSPGATLTMVSQEEIRAVMDVTSARNLMNELHVLLDEWKENSGTNMTHMKQDTAPIATHMATVHEQGEVENHRVRLDTKMKLHFGERVTHIKSYWEDMNEQFQKGYKNASRTISLLQKIEEVLTKLPTSCRAKLHARFSGLCAEADTIMDTVMDRIMIQCDKKPSRSNVFFHELATSSYPSS